MPVASNNPLESVSIYVPFFVYRTYVDIARIQCKNPSSIKEPLLHPIYCIVLLELAPFHVQSYQVTDKMHRIAKIENLFYTTRRQTASWSDYHTIRYVLPQHHD